jgi:hypothetical protein
MHQTTMLALQKLMGCLLTEVRMDRKTRAAFLQVDSWMQEVEKDHVGLDATAGE